jgi:hypothetical protein
MRQLTVFLLLLAACDRPKTEPESVRPAAATASPGPSASNRGATPASEPSAAPSASAPTSQASASAAGHPGGFCSAALTPADIQAACGVAVTLVPGADSDEIAGAPGGCSRRYAAGGRSLTLVLNRLASPAQAKTSFDGQAASRKEEPEFKALTGLGEGARRYVSINLTGDLLSSVEWVSGPYVARVFSPKVSSNGNQFEPVCPLDKLESLARTASARLK